VASAETFLRAGLVAGMLFPEMTMTPVKRTIQTVV
jgi:hypothetical protein